MATPDQSCKPDSHELPRRRHLDSRDMPGFLPRGEQMPLDEFFKWIEHIRRVLPLTDEQRALRDQTICTEEFIL